MGGHMENRDRDKDIVIYRDKDIVKNKRFIKPTVKDITPYCKEKGIDPCMFYDHYESNGWKVGKNPMKDWKATVRKWARRGDFNGAKKGNSQEGIIRSAPGKYANISRKI